MTYVLLGNGFDLHHGLPTGYQDVIDIYKHWIKNKELVFDSVGDLLHHYCCEHQHSKISKFYNNHQKALSSVPIDYSDANDLLKALEDNCWFRLFSNDSIIDNYNTKSNWFDFESMIEHSLSVLKNIMKSNSFLAMGPREVCPNVSIHEFAEVFTNVVSCSDYFGTYQYLFKNTYKPAFFSDWMIDTTAVYDSLYDHLTVLKKALVYYLSCFIHPVLSPKMKSKALAMLDRSCQVVNLNYTHTWEKLYQSEEYPSHISHYHGDVNNNIVLGIGSTQEDEWHGNISPSTDTIKFKKHYQRIQYNSDSELLKWQEENRYYEQKYKHNPYAQVPQEHSLIIIGHSLDMTDEDIIRRLFSICKKQIIIYYHNDEAKSNYIINLLRMFGKTEFESMRNNGILKFVQLADYEPVERNSDENQL